MKVVTKNSPDEHMDEIKEGERNVAIEVAVEEVVVMMLLSFLQ